MSAQTYGNKENAGSLFNESNYRNPYLDLVARQPGDLLTVLISESSVASFSAQTSATKSDDSSVAGEFFGGFIDRIFTPFNTGADSTVSGDGATSQNNRMTAEMTVMVKEVMPNGNLIIEGRRSLVTNKNTQTMVLTGVVRPFDVTPANTVESMQIGEAEIRMEGEGMIMERQRKGILTQVIDWLF
ncbi:MAG: flagellar basal body L-ring protein FlgH [Fimbriimonadaceae bacterium]